MTPEVPTTDPLVAARAAGLRYVSDADPGLRRMKQGKGFAYRDADGRAVHDEETLARVKRLAVPPAWTDVWICPRPDGHIQATGRDARGRKQYRYHGRWRTVRDETKYDRMIAFGKLLPAIRKRVAADLARPGLPREKVLATVVSLLEATLIRVGNDEYARQNNSFGLTTLKDRHVKFHANGRKVVFRFRGKHGKQHEIELEDPRLARIVKSCRDLPGQELFQFVDDEGVQRTLGSGDVNDYLREITGEDFTAKDFRTWSGTVLAAVALGALETFRNQREAKKNIIAAIEQVAERLGNTVAICRRCYVHPAIFATYMENGLPAAQPTRKVGRRRGHALSADETAVLGLLQRQLKQKQETIPSLLRRSIARARKRAA